jgi:hypothetical protein
MSAEKWIKLTTLEVPQKYSNENSVLSEKAVNG